MDVYLFPAVVGGGLGDIAEVLAAGHYLARAGFPLHLYRAPGRALPPGVEGPWDWPRIVRSHRLVPRSEKALTVTPSWGVSAGPSRPGRYGRGGVWEVEAGDVERAYGTEGTLHVSLEEFARTLSSVAETRERFREGGVHARAIAARLRSARSSREVEEFATAFRSFRGFDRPNVLHLFPTFVPDRRFAREFPQAVQVGPLGSGPRTTARRPAGTTNAREWVWYASPASAERLVRDVAAGLSDARPPVRLYVRTPRSWPAAAGLRGVHVRTTPVPAAVWRNRFFRAELRIVKGSRTLIEAIEVGGPFLYFNGVLGRGAARRRHRPEKIRAWLARARRAGVSEALRSDLADFARGRRVVDVVRRASQRADGWARFPSPSPASGFPRGRSDAGQVLVAVAREFARPGARSRDVVARWRNSNP